MYGRLADFPVLDEYPSRIAAPVWNAWRRYLHRRLAGVAPPQLRFALPGLEPFEAILEERLWVCVDPTHADSPVLAWRRFVDAERTDISAPVGCTVLQYHFGASAVRERALAAIGVELSNRLRG